VIADAIGSADQLDRHFHGDFLVRADLIKVDVDDRAAAKRIPLDFADERLHRGAVIDRDVDERAGMRAHEEPSQRPGVDLE
jgi:hypothetical protein